MGFTDIFSTPDPAAASVDSEKEEVFRKLTEELVKVREERNEAVERLRDLEDSLKLKEGILDTLERRIENLELENHRLLSVETELSLLRQDQLLHPLSSTDALHRYTQLSSIFLSLRDTLSCAVCYEPYTRSQAISLLCGHSFCQPCFQNWESRHVEAWKLNPNQQGVYPGPDCPECRSREVRRGKMRVWALEETVRLVERAVREIEGNQFTPKKEDVTGDSSAESQEEKDTESEVKKGKPEERGTLTGDGEGGGVNELNESNDADLASSTPHSEGDPITIDDPTAAEPENSQVDTRVAESSTESPPSPSFVPSEPHNSLAQPSPSTDADSMNIDLSPNAGVSDEPIPAEQSRNENENSIGSTPLPPSPSAPAPASASDPVDETQDSTMNTQDHNVDEEELEEARNLLRPRTPNPYVAVFRR
ncbi:uncharacterized protein JCM6883_004218 [Sporobolomyces salmoneus]|uniref:uncharacterized protein n=1 Tax=Sporobolomyces salmoneus TaxID=183962 RepID=UPI00316C1405